ncbi:MAG: hypothetical protein FJ249_00605 [Nitrospira sp.]|nr:hypothetical protein [Nitrospira sp.]
MRALFLLLLLALAFAGTGNAETSIVGDGTGAGGTGPAPATGPDLSSLNIRLSSRAIRPPDEVVKKAVSLEGIRVARPVTGEPTRAVILEDDARQRVLVLSLAPDQANSGEGRIQAYLLVDINLESRLPQLIACSNQRRCAEDRTPGVGGLGCVAFCLVETLRP